MLNRLILLLCLRDYVSGFLSPNRQSQASIQHWGTSSSSNHNKPFGTTRTAAISYRLATENAEQRNYVSPIDSSPSLLDHQTTAQQRILHPHEEETKKSHHHRHHPLPVDDPSLVEFAPSEKYRYDAIMDTIPRSELSTSFYPFAMMMQGSAPYIAEHTEKTAVIHIPGELLEDHEATDQLFSDLALAWLLGMKIVMVIGCRYDIDSCDMDFIDHPHECHNSLKVTDADTLRRCEEEAGYLRTEVERKLNRYLRMHGGVAIASSSTPEDAPVPEGNVVSGNFYTALRFGTIRGEDYEHTGFTSRVKVDNIRHALDNNDVVLLTTVGMSPLGDLVNVNGYHLTASVASALEAYKLIFMSTEGSVLKKKGEETPIQEIPLSFAQSLLDYHQVQVHNTGFATFELARQSLESRAVELLLHLGWATWALDHGVQRAHMVNPSDGAILEELFTSKNGANTCLYHDVENQESEDALFQEDWDKYFASARKQSRNVTTTTTLR